MIGSSKGQGIADMKTHIVFIHGLANKPPKADLQRIWLDALGQSHDGYPGFNLGTEGVSTSFVYWADLFYDTPIDPSEYESVGEVEDQLDRSFDHVLRTNDSDSIDWITSLESKLDVELGEKPNDAEVEDQSEFEWIPLPQATKEKVMRRFAREAHDYLFNENGIRDIIRQRVLDELVPRKQEKLILVGHSQGSFIAYDVLTGTDECPEIGGFLTLGSPLGVDEIQRELSWSRDNGFPEKLTGDWVNVYDPLDPVARLDPKLANDFKRNGTRVVLDISEPNWGLWRHSATKYLKGRQLRTQLRRLAGRERVSGTNLPFVDELNKAVELNNRSKVASLVECYSPAELSQVEQLQVLQKLRSAQYDQELEKAACQTLEANGFNPSVMRLQAQALIDQGNLQGATSVLETLNEQIDWNNLEKNEVVGLIGRVKKQQYVESQEGHYLQSAIQHYQQGWNAKKGDYRWTGINYAALMARQDRDNASTSNSAVVQEVASQIISEVELLQTGNQATLWDYGSAMEASIALDDKDAAYRWAKAYVKQPTIDAFALAGTIRQLDEIWASGNNSSLANILKPVLQHELFLKPGSNVMLQDIDLSDNEGFEAIYGNFGITALSLLENILTKARSVVQIARRSDGIGFASGFVIRGGDLDSELGDKLILLTNAHAINENPENSRDGVRPSDVLVNFTKEDGEPSCRIGKKLFFSKKTELDIWVSELDWSRSDDEPVQESQLELTFYEPIIPDEASRIEPAYVVGHPGRDGPISISMNNNAIISYERPYVQYQSPTLRGSSGGPTLTANLDVFAVHHKTRKDLKLNQGVLINEIKNAFEDR